MSSTSWTLTEHITAHLGQRRLGDAPPPSLWPSDASAVLRDAQGDPYVVGACRRATFLRYTTAWYQFKGGETRYDTLVGEVFENTLEPDKYMRWIWEAGNLFEDYIIEMSKRSGVYLASQVKITIPKYNVTGKVDLIVTNPQTGRPIAQEIKSIYGHNSNEVLGTPGMRNKRSMGKPRDSNLMQIAIYDWHLRTRMSDLEASRLLYGARDTGRYGEFEVSTYVGDDGVTHIKYQGVSPFLTPAVVSPITVDEIFNNYVYVQQHYDAGVVPPRDYSIQYTDEQITKLYEKNELGKTNREAYEKIQARKAENIQRAAEGKAPKKELKPLEIGDWHCTNCTFRRYCYNEDNVPVRD